MNPEIEKQIEDHNQRIYDGKMTPQQKDRMREMLNGNTVAVQVGYDYWDEKDYSYGNDEGEPPQGASW